MLKGEFSLYVFLLDEEGVHVYDQKVIPSAFAIETSEEYRFGLIEAEHAWENPGTESGAGPEPTPVAASLAESALAAD
jgi:hypothetical protein